MKTIKAKATINLGRKPDYTTDVVSVPAPEQPQEPEIIYPSVYLSDIDGIELLPKQGKAVITYKIRSKTTREDSGDDDKDVSVEMQLMSITPEKIVEPQTDNSESGDAMEELMANMD